MSQRSGMIICMVLIAMGLSSVGAQPRTSSIYLPVVVRQAGALETLVLQRADVPTSYTRTARFVENTEEANSYPDPKAAMIAFQEQGRDTSFYAIFTSQAFASSGALSISNKVARYGTMQGAQAGQAFALAASQIQGFEPITVPTLSRPAIGLRRTVAAPGEAALRVQYQFSIQQDVYLALVYVVGYADVLTLDQALAFAEKAIVRLPNNR